MKPATLSSVGLTAALQRSALTRASCDALAASVAAVTVLHMKLAIELPPAQADKLRAEAQRLGLSVEELARAALADLLSAPDAEFQDVARRVISKNRELYKRLA
jgi:hypothetical protein